MMKVILSTAAALLLGGATLAVAQDDTVKDGTLTPPRSQTDVQQDSPPVENNTNLPEAQPAAPVPEEPASIADKEKETLMEDGAGTGAGSGTAQDLPTPPTQYPPKSISDKERQTTGQ